MTGQPQKEPFTFLKIEYFEEPSTNVIALLRLDTTARFNLAVNPLDENLQGQKLIDQLEARGALVNDMVDEEGKVVPAYQEFAPETGQRTALRHCRAGLLQDPEWGKPAVEEFDRKTGRRVYLAHHVDGFPHDPEFGEPACQEFSPTSGLITRARHYHVNRPNDVMKTLTSSELAALNEAKGLLPSSLPEHLKQYEVHGMLTPHP